LWLPSIEVLAWESGASKASTDLNKIERLSTKSNMATEIDLDAVNIEELASLRDRAMKNDLAKNDETSHEVTEPVADAA